MPDAGMTLLGRLDSLDAINVVSWRYDDLPGLGLDDASTHTTPDLRLWPRSCARSRR